MKTAMTMAVLGLAACATLPPRPVGSVQDEEIRMLAAHFQKSLDCRPGAKDPNAFMCPLAALRVEPFVPPRPRRVLAGVSLELEEDRAGVLIDPDFAHPVLLSIGPGSAARLAARAPGRAEEDWDAALGQALADRLAGRPAAVVWPPSLTTLARLAALPDERSATNWEAQPERFFHVRTPTGGHAIVEIEPLPGTRVRVSMFPVPETSSPAQAAAEARERKALEAAYQKNVDWETKPLDSEKVAGLRAWMRNVHTCEGHGFPWLCALAHVALGGAPLPGRDARYLGVSFEFFPNRQRRWQLTKPHGVLSALLVGPNGVQPANLGPDDAEEARAIEAATTGILDSLTGRARGPLTTSRAVFDDLNGFGWTGGENPFFDGMAVRLYEGFVPGGDRVYVLLAPRHGGGAFVGLYPEVPWTPTSPPSTTTAAR